MLPFQKYRKVMVFDVETTGLIPKKDPITKRNPSLSEKPYIIQLSFIVYNIVDGCIDEISNSYINVDESVEVSEFITGLTGITRETLNTRGIPMIDALRKFYEHYMTVDCVVAHNIQFDSSLLMIEIERHYGELEKTIPQILNIFNPIYLKWKNMDTCCTMKSSIYICNLLTTSATDPTKTYKKFPKLVELYKNLFNVEAVNLHNSLVDTLYTLRCFLKLKIHVEVHDVKFQHMLERVHSII